MEKRSFGSDTLLLITAAIWGFGFVAQRAGMPHMGPFLFSGIRFAMGALFLAPFLVVSCARKKAAGAQPDHKNPIHKETENGLGRMISDGCLVGSFLFMGVTLQQVGLVYTTAGNAGFITGLYVVIVPIAGLFFGLRVALGTWIGVCMAGVGLYFLSVTDQFTISFGDILEFAGAFFWAGHVIVADRVLKRMDPLMLATIQFLFCSVLSMAAALFFEEISMEGISGAAIPLLYGGFGSVGIAYTLQLVAQRHAAPAHVVIILCLETVFAAFGGWLILGEELSARAIFGAGLMLLGMIVSQLTPLILNSFMIKRLKERIWKT